MAIHDDALPEEAVRQTVAALNDSAHQLGKVDRSLSPEQIEEVEEAIKRLQSRLDLKRRLLGA